MRLVATKDAMGHVLCHDMTQILPGGTDAEGNELPRYKGARFRKGHVVTAEDVPVLLSMGKAHLYVWQRRPGWLHEDEAARRMAALCLGEGCVAAGEPREGKIGINAAHDGVFLVDSERLAAVNSVDQVMVATRRGNFGVRAGDALAGTRVIPLVIDGAVVAQAEAAADVAAHGPLMRVAPYVMRTAAVIATGSEVKSGLIEDRFTPVVERKLARFGVSVTWRATPGDAMDDVVAAIAEARAAGVDMVLCTGGMSVDPDDNTPGAIKRAGARIVTYGAPVLRARRTRAPYPWWGCPGASCTARRPCSTSRCRAWSRACRSRSATSWPWARAGSAWAATRARSRTARLRNGQFA